MKLQSMPHSLNDFLLRPYVLDDRVWTYTLTYYRARRCTLSERSFRDCGIHCSPHPIISGEMYIFYITLNERMRDFKTLNSWCWSNRPLSMQILIALMFEINCSSRAPNKTEEKLTKMLHLTFKWWQKYSHQLHVCPARLHTHQSRKHWFFVFGWSLPPKSSSWFWWYDFLFLL